MPYYQLRITPSACVPRDRTKHPSCMGCSNFDCCPSGCSAYYDALKDASGVGPPAFPQKRDFLPLFRNLCVGSKAYLAPDDLYILCWETKNKFDEECAHHYHFNFTCEKAKPTVRAYIVRYCDKLNIALRGNKMYSLRAVTEPNDMQRWLRYCMKENYLKKWTRLTEYSEHLANMELCAKDERARAVTANIERREAQLEKKSMYDKLEETLYAAKHTTRKEIFKEICKYYAEKKQAIVPKTITGYTVLYMYRQKLISPDSLFESAASQNSWLQN